MHNLRLFLDRLQREGELVRVETPVSSDLEIAEIHRRVIASAGPALLFTNVEGADFPCVTNLFGTPKRVDLAFGPGPSNLSINWCNWPRTCPRYRRASSGRTRICSRPRSRSA